MIKVTHLTKRYGDHAAVSDLNFTVDHGIYGFLGPNGAGKSTTMNMIAGCLAMTEGEISIDGFDIVANADKAKQLIGYLPEQPPLYPDMTPEEYLTFVARAKGVEKSAVARSVAQVMEKTHLADMKDRLIRNLSKGYRQRVGIAQAMLGEPHIIILDEPTVGLDPKQILEIRDLIRELGETKTVLLSSHILAEISAVCDRVMVLSHGKLVGNGTPEELRSRFAKEDKIVLQIKGDRETATRILQGVKLIQSVQMQEIDKNTLQISLTAVANADIREPLFFAFADAKVPILSMQSTAMTLEDIFLRLTEDKHREKEKTKKPKGNKKSKADDYTPVFGAPVKEDEE